MSNVSGQLFKTLRDGPRVITRAAFWKIPHRTQPDTVAFKIGRYKRPKGAFDSAEPETLEPKSELTLDDEEFRAMIEFLQDNYEPFRQGVRAFIPLKAPYTRHTAGQIRAFFSAPDSSKLVNFIVENGIIPNTLALALQATKRGRAISQFEQMLKGDLVEGDWQKWFEENSWVLGSDFVRVLDERVIDAQHISDFLLEAYDGFLDIVEIKRPEGNLEFWAAALDHGHYVPSQILVKAITQAARYVYEVEREANSIKFLQRVDNVRTVKPRCVLIFSRSAGWNEHQVEAYRILNSGYHNLSILSYDHVLDRAKRIAGREC
jgi:hypothetical protein